MPHAINPALEYAGIAEKTKTFRIGGARDIEGPSIADVCMLILSPEANAKTEYYKALCAAFTGSENPKEKKNPVLSGKIRYIPDFETYALIGDPRCSLEQRADLAVKGAEQVIKVGGKYEVVKKPFFEQGKKVKDYPSSEPKGHPVIAGMQSQHPKRKNGRVIFNSVYGEKGNYLPGFSYTRDQMRMGRQPEEGSNLVFLYPECYEKAWEDTAQRRELELLGIMSREDLFWENAKEYKGFEWEAARVNSNGKISNIIELEQKPSSGGPGLIILTIGKNGASATSPYKPSAGVVGSTGLETQVGAYILEWDISALEKIRYWSDISKELLEAIEKRKGEPAMQIGITTKKRGGAVKEFDYIWEAIEWKDPLKMWNIPAAANNNYIPVAEQCADIAFNH